MSNVVWLLYLADVCNSVSTVAIITAMASAAVIVFGGLITIGEWDHLYTETQTIVKRVFRALVVAFCISVTLVLLVPAKSVILACAGVEATKIVVVDTANKSPLIDKSLKLIEKQLDEALKDKRPSEEKK